MQYGLSAQHIAAINSVFSKHGQIERAIIYGSRAKGNYRHGSDIDLVLKATSLEFSELLRIENELDDLMLPYLIDIANIDEIENSDLIDHIQRVGQPFYIRDLNSLVNENDAPYPSESQ